MIHPGAAKLLDIHPKGQLLDANTLEHEKGGIVISDTSVASESPQMRLMGSLGRESE